MASLKVSTQTLAVATTITALTVFVLNWYSAKRKNRIPQKWKRVGTVAGLFMYPMKSGRRTDLKRAECTITGFKQISEPGRYQLSDRTLVVYKDSAKECRSLKTSPKMVSIVVTVGDDNRLFVNAPGMETLRLDIMKILDKARGDLREEVVSFWGEEKFGVIDCGDEAAHWVTTYLEGNVPLDSRIGVHDGLYTRPFNKTLQGLSRVYPRFTNTAMGIYADLTSFLLINQASVDELAARIPNINVSVNNFRPNIVVSDDNLLPFEEDEWEWIKIGDVIVKNVKACTRCTATTIDPEAGTRIANMEPLRTLKSYRIIKDLIKTDEEKNSPIMGIHLGLITNGIVNVGDTVSIARSEY